MKLTAPQRLIYDAEKFIGGSVSVMCGVMTVDRPCPEERVKEAIREIYRTNDALNLRLDDAGGEPELYLTDPDTREIPVVRVDDVKELERIGQTAALTPFDMTGPLSDLRAVLYPGGYGIVLRVHHLLGDAWSMSLIGTQLNEILEGKTSVRYSYRDYTAQENAYLESRRCEKDRAFFLNRFESCPEPVLLADRTSEDYDAEFLRLNMPAGTRKKLTDFAQKNDLSETALLFGLFALFFAKYRGCPDAFYIGMPVLGRVSEKDLSTVGMYVNLAPVLIRPDYQASLLENILSIADEILSVFRHQRYNYGQLLRELRETGQFSGRLYDVIVNFQSDEILADAVMRSTEYPRGRYPETLQLTFSHRNGEEGLTVDYIFRTAQLSAADVSALHARLNRLARILLQTPDLPLAALSILSDKELPRLAAFEPGPNVPIPEKSVYDLFSDQATKTPDAIAVAAEDRTLTYEELDILSDRVAAGLQMEGVKPGDRVAFCLQRDSRLFTAIFGILKTGASYVPVDRELPETRKDFYLSDSGAKTLLTEEDVDRLEKTGAAGFVPARVLPSDACYLIYTSGSTGTPKGVVVTHRNVVNYCVGNENGVYGGAIPRGTKTILSLTSVSFDIFVTESLLPLLNGLSVVLANETQSTSPAAFRALMKNAQPDVLQTTPSRFDVLTAGMDLQTLLRHTKTLLLGGEALLAATAKRILRESDAALFNMYGPAETTVWSAFAKIVDGETITIGRPITNTRIYVLDRYLQPAPIGVTGQICIAGAGVGDGYLNRPGLTEERFVSDPFGEGKMYLTGDLGYWGEDGNLVFVGRNDFQIKLNGRRIELGEIEAALSAVPGVSLAAVKVQKDGDRQLLAAYYTGAELTDLTLRQTLAVTLPRYMIPQVFVRLDEMPLTVSGKIDRKALPETELALLESKTEYAPPETETEKMLVETAGEILHRTGIGMLDNFFDLGGDSLKAIELIARLERHGLSCLTRDVFDAVDFKALAKKLTVSKETETDLPDIGNAVPLTAAGREIYAAETLSPDLPLYNITYVLRVKELDPVRLQNAVDALIKRYEILRSHVETPDGVPTLVSEEKAECKIEKIEGEPEGFIRPFDLTKAPLLRVGYRDDLLVFDIHHLIADGSSMPLYFAALDDLYMGREPEKASVPYKYFAHWANEKESDLPYWTELFSDGVPEADLPTDHSRPAVPRHKGKTLYRQIGSETEQAIRVLGKKEGVTPFVCYLAAFSILLARYSGKEDLVVGVPTSGRDTQNKDVPGLFVNTLPLRLRPEGAQSVSAYLQRLREAANDAQAHGQISYAELARELGANRTDKNPLFDVMFTYQREEMTAPVFADHPAEVLPVDLHASKYDFDLTVYPRESGAAYAVTYDADLYEERTICRMMDGFETILSQLSGAATLADLSAVTDEEEARIAAFGTGPVTDLPDASVYDLFREQAAKTPDEQAVIAEDRTLTYHELDVLSDRVAAGLQEKGVKSGDRVAFALPRKSVLFTAILGILKAGAAYVPVDDDLPESRKDYYLRDSGARLCLTEEMVRALEQTDAPYRPVSVSGTDGAYVVYTSGSTGEPKGVRILHRNLTNYVTSLKEIYGARVSMPVFTSVGVDLTVTSLFLPLVTGGEAHAYAGQFGETLGAIRENENITVIKGTPTHLRLMTQNGAKFPAGVNALILGGEALTGPDARQFAAALAEGGEIHNEYGPTETAVGCMDYVFGQGNGEKAVPIGKPIRNTRVYVLDRDLLPAPIGVTGQICIAGAGVADGYLNRAALTAEKFIDDPFGGGKMYLTGDLGYWREDGELVFVGRNDFQVKLNGQRVEPGEIEAALNAVPGITNAAVKAQTDGERQTLCAYYTGEEKATEDLRAALAVTLPRYMIPQAFVRLDKMPLTVSGKIDRNALPQADLTQIRSETAYVPPETEEERVLAEVFADVLGVEKAGRNDNFFALGGDSIRAIYVASRLQSRGWDLSVPDLMRVSDLGALAGKLRALGAQTVPVADTGTNRLPLPPAARAYLARRPEMPADFSQSCMIRTAADADTIKKSLEALTRRHPILRAAFTGDALAIPPENGAPPVRFSVETVSAEEGGEAEARRRLQARNVRFDLETGPLLDAALCAVGNEGLLRLTVHHLAVDLFSWEILLGDLTRLINAGGDGTALPEPTAGYAGWTKALEAYAAGMSAEESAYWERAAWKAARAPALAAPDDPELPGETKTMTVDKELADKLLKLERDEDVRLDVSLLAAFGSAAGELSGGEALICAESLGRPVLPAGVPVDGVVGWLTAIYPLNVEPQDDVTRLLFDVRRELKGVPQSGIGWLLRYGRLPDNASLMFNFYRSLAAEGLNAEPAEPTGDASLDALFPGFVSADCAYADGKLTVRLSCPPMRRRETLIEDLSRAFFSALTAIAGTADFSSRRADAADGFSDDRLTYDELNELEAIFDETDGT